MDKFYIIICGFGVLLPIFRFPISREIPSFQTTVNMTVTMKYILLTNRLLMILKREKNCLKKLLRRHSRIACLFLHAEIIFFKKFKNIPRRVSIQDILHGESFRVPSMDFFLVKSFLLYYHIKEINYHYCREGEISLDLFEMFSKGGYVMYLLLLSSVAVAGIGIERDWIFTTTPDIMAKIFWTPWMTNLKIIPLMKLQNFVLPKKAVSAW